MVSSIRNIEHALGSSEKKPTASELENRKAARRSLVAAKPLATGTILTRDDLSIKRPGDGIAPVELEGFIGSKLRVAKQSDELMTWEDVERERNDD